MAVYVDICPCTADCARHGKCCGCVAHHRDHEGGIPGKKGEAVWDRCLGMLCKDRGLELK